MDEGLGKGDIVSIHYKSLKLDQNGVCIHSGCNCCPQWKCEFSDNSWIFQTSKTHFHYIELISQTLSYCSDMYTHLFWSVYINIIITLLAQKYSPEILKPSPEPSSGRKCAGLRSSLKGKHLWLDVCKHTTICKVEHLV